MNEIAKPVGIIGAGTMGEGIAQAAAAAGWSTLLFDIHPHALANTMKRIEARLLRLTEKNRITEEQSKLIYQKIIPTENIQDLRNCDFIIECVDEVLETKIQVLKEIATIAPDAVLATNTSSLSITQIAEGSGSPDRVVGTHFFNPAAIMPLVEIIKGTCTSDAAASCATLIIEAWGKTTVHPADFPGFIVNRVARPYYLEAWRILQESIAPVDTIDAAMRSLGEFKMGPFELMDMLGHDLSFATSQRIWTELGQPSRLKPCEMQEQLLQKGHLGKKTGCGAYAYDDRDNIVPAIIIDQQELELPDHLNETINAFCVEAAVTSGNKLDRYIYSRILVSIINEALWTQSDGVASAEDIDTAMKLGTNYPKGPLEYCNYVGVDLVHELLAALNKTVSDNRFAGPPRLVGENS